jgi:Putative ABC exporter
MLDASLYIIWCTWRNRMRKRIRRLREPRYLLGAIAGVAYLYLTFFARLRSARVGARRQRTTPAALMPALGASGPALAGLLLLAVAAASWVFPLNSGLLDFSKAETQFLFPAPLTRRQLMMHRLLRSQLAVLFGTIIMAFFYPSPSAGGRVRLALSMWLFLMTSHVFFTGVTLARARFGAAGATRRIARAPLAVTLAALAIVGGAIGQELWRHPAETARDAMIALGTVSMRGLPHAILLPFMTLVSPFFADGWTAFARSFGAAAIVFVMTLAWVMRTDEAFDVAAEEVAEKHAGQPAKAIARYRARPIAWNLALTGRPEAAFIWKAALQTFRVVDRRILIRMVLIVVWLVLVVAFAPGRGGFAQIIGVFAAIGSAFAVVMAPQLMRLDLRQDLQNLDVLKTWPVRAAAVVRGEIAWPAAVITVIAWGLGAIALFFSAAVFEETGLVWRTAVGVAGLILAPALVAAQYTIHNAAALIFPAWVPVGSGRPRGVDAMGQRLILLGATWLMLLVSLIPGFIVGAILWVAFFRFVGPWVLVPAALICVATVAVEVLLATEALGPAYERLDITSVERPE